VDVAEDVEFHCRTRLPSPRWKVRIAGGKV
jgi:hypothetical protein